MFLILVIQPFHKADAQEFHLNLWAHLVAEKWIEHLSFPYQGKALPLDDSAMKLESNSGVKPLKPSFADWYRSPRRFVAHEKW